MIQAKLFVIGQEIELLWTEMDYYREVQLNGKPSSKVLGGAITVCFATTPKTDLIIRWMTKESTDDTNMELDKMEEGKICFYLDGFDNPATKTYKFNDAFPIEYKETFSANNDNPLQTIMTISPAIQNYGAELIKLWNVSYIPPSEAAPYQQQTTEVEKQLVDYYLTDANGNKIEEYEVGDRILLHIKTKNRINDIITIHLEDKSHDFIYKGEVLKDDKLTDYKIKSDIERIELEVIVQSSQN